MQAINRALSCITRVSRGLKRRGALAFVVAGLAVAAAGSDAKAATITSVITFSATGFGGAPIEPVVGSFTITYDPAVSVTNVTGPAIQQNYLNIPLGSAIAFSYNAAAQYLTIGGLAQGANSFLWGTNDFFFALSGLTADSYYLPSPNLSYTLSDPGAAYTTFNVAVTVAPAAVTPLPASALLFLTALGGLGFAGFKRRRAAA